MSEGFRLLPYSASTFANELDLLFGYLVAVAAFFALLIAVLIVFFAVRYRRRSRDESGKPILQNVPLELAWTIIPLLFALSFFGWGANLFFRIETPPDNPLEIFVVGKQWMWKIQHQEGQREINELHVPTGRPVKLTLTSEDVIHSFYVPAFRVKQDVVPGRYTTMWFEATRPGEYHLFCAEYCGTDHALMGGRVVVMTPADYQAWLSGGASSETMAQAGERLFNQIGCVTCHAEGATQRCPLLVGLYGGEVTLADGRTVHADDDYVRESIVDPTAKITAGYDPIMPTYQGQISEERLLQLIAYVRSLASEQQ
jgi:cytochrome c oxidase subunit 2